MRALLAFFLFGVQPVAPVDAEAPSPPQPLDRPHWITADDYPLEALRSLWDGKTSYLLDVTAEGTVGACSITHSSGHAILDEATCDALRSRARFTPALDQTGKVVAGQFSGSASWAIPDRGPAPLVPAKGVIDFDVDEQGHAHNCKSTIPQGSWPNLSDLCMHFQKAGPVPELQFEPANGAVRHVTIHFDMKVNSPQ